MGGYIGATAVGLTTTAADVQGDITSTDTTPEVILKNTTETDADGGREGTVTFKGEKSGGEEVTLAQIEGSHDDTNDDSRGQLVFKTNNNQLGDNVTEAKMTIDSVGDVDVTSGAPSITITNTTHEDTDGGRESKLKFKGEQSGGELSTLAQIEASHDGTADDEKGDLIFKTNDGSDGASPTEAMRIQSDQKVGMGTITPSRKLAVKDSSVTVANFESTSGTSGLISFSDSNTTNDVTVRAGAVGDHLVLQSGGAERMRIDSAGRLLIGTTTEGQNQADNLTVSDSGNMGMTLRSTDSGECSIFFSDGTSGTPEYAGSVQYIHSDNSLRMATNAAERMRINSSGYIGIGRTDPVQRLDVSAGTANQWACRLRHDGFGGTNYFLQFDHGGGVIGSVTGNGSSVTYATSSDYRLKENVVDITDGITRVKQLEPKKFNFIADADTTVDGFLAHEAQAVVPEAITGTKDEVEVWADSDELPDGVSVGDNKLDDDGNTIPLMQGIDQSKLVPLLTAALQEAIAKIETLEAQNTTQATQIADLITRVTALEG